MSHDIENSIENLLMDNNTYLDKENTMEDTTKYDNDKNNELSILEVLANEKKIVEKKNEKEESNKEESEKYSVKTSSIKSRSRERAKSLSTTESDDKMYSYKRRIVNKENKNEHIKNEKKEILYKMTKIKGDKYFKYDITYTLDELQTAYYQMMEKKKNDMAVEQYKKVLKAFVLMIEILNNQLDPVGLDLNGWSEAMAYSLENEEYDQVLTELYDKYKHVIQMSPELKLAGMLSMSAISFAITKKMMGGTSNSTPNILGTVLSMFSGGGGNGMMKELNKTTTEDFEPSKLKTPTLNDSDSNDGIDEIFKKMEESKRKKELEKETIKNITLNKRNRNKKK